MDKIDSVQNLLKKYGYPVPRYTSYPPATQFRKGNASELFRKQLTELTGHHPVSLYFHIPFCRSLCSYCGCMTRVVHDDEPIRDYVRLLEKEINLVATTLRFQPRVDHIHFGGGSPNLLSSDDLHLLLSAVRSNFILDDKVEIAMEVDPRQLSEKKVKDYARAGINRISMGVQDFQEKTQKAINRIQPFSVIEECTRWLKNAGIERVNFDLMYGLPYQTVESVSDNIDQALSLNPDRIALFGYAHVPWMKPHQKILEKYALPDFSQRYFQAKTAREKLLKAGYIAIGMDHFSKKDDPMTAAYETGALRRNFQGYTDDTSITLIGFGLSAISRFPGAFIQNTSSGAFYKERIEKGQFADERWMAVDDEDRLRAEIIESLMCYFEADCGKICVKSGFPEGHLDKSIQKLDLMEEDGLLRREGRLVVVDPDGRSFIRTIAACFDEYYEEGVDRHAIAV